MEDRLIQWKYILGGIDVAILLIGILTWAVGKIKSSEKLKGLSYGLFGVWIVLDFVLVIIAYCFGWFA